MEALKALVYDLVDRALERETVVTVLVIYLIVSGAVTDQASLIGLLTTNGLMMANRAVVKVGEARYRAP